MDIIKIMDEVVLQHNCYELQFLFGTTETKRKYESLQTQTTARKNAHFRRTQYRKL